MSISAIKTRLLIIVASLAALTTLFGLSATTASAATSNHVAAAAAHTKAASSASYGNTAVLWSYGNSNDFPTWLWSATTLCTTNLGGNYGLLQVQSWSPFAGPEYVSVAPGATKCIARNWYGVPVRGTNVGSSLLLVTSR